MTPDGKRARKQNLLLLLLIIIIAWHCSIYGASVRMAKCSIDLAEMLVSAMRLVFYSFLFINNA